MSPYSVRRQSIQHGSTQGKEQSIEGDYRGQMIADDDALVTHTKTELLDKFSKACD
ncbi:hypothetical protein DPMN_075688 [Dreissena polymorpha]|uniref:Uncharacterized protein n=1 Tax=Dreissena polymorpha TaxID=45954 RepID=A0A9D3YHG9_DREPO|nr:hypothetical protein DPMN_075688 [Dreissena polymorpha]